jgi:phage gp29-like protein
MEMKHPETEHVVDSSAHDDCVDKVEEALSHAEEHEYPEHIIELLEGVLGELEEYESVEKDEDGSEIKDEEDVDDDELEEAKNKEMYEGKPMLKIRIGVKPKE